MLEIKKDEILDKLKQLGWTVKIVKTDDPGNKKYYATWTNPSRSPLIDGTYRSIGQILYVGIAKVIPGSVYEYVLHLFD